MCGTPFWGVAATIACGYFAYLSYSQLRGADYQWQHEWWTVLTWAVWVVLIAGLVSETQCWRERVFFMVLLLNFLLGFILAAWSTAAPSTVRAGRELSLGLWVLAGLASLGTLVLPPQATQKDGAPRE